MAKWRSLHWMVSMLADYVHLNGFRGVLHCPESEPECLATATATECAGSLRRVSATKSTTSAPELWRWHSISTAHVEVRGLCMLNNIREGRTYSEVFQRKIGQNYSFKERTLNELQGDRIIITCLLTMIHWVEDRTGRRLVLRSRRSTLHVLTALDVT